MYMYNPSKAYQPIWGRPNFIKFIIPGWCTYKGDVTRDDLQWWFLVQHSVALLEQCCNSYYSKQCHNKCCNAVLCSKSSLRIVSCNITLSIIYCVFFFSWLSNRVNHHIFKKVQTNFIIWTDLFHFVIF